MVAGAAMHRNCYLGRAFSVLPRRRFVRMNAADRPTKSLVDSQTSDVDSIPIAPSITHGGPIGLTRQSYINPRQKWTVWTQRPPMRPIGPKRAIPRADASYNTRNSFS